LENSLEINSTKERFKMIPFLDISSIVTSWALFHIHQSINQGTCSFLLTISHASYGLSFLGKNQRSFITSKISKPLLKYNQQRRYKSSEQIIGESMSTMRLKIFFMRPIFSCSTRVLILRNKTKLLSRKKDL
jgi:hypothetical protein